MDQSPPTCWLFMLEKIYKILEGGHTFSTYAKFSEKTIISYPLKCTRTCVYEGLRNVSFLEKFAYVLNEWFQDRITLVIKDYDGLKDVVNICRMCHISDFVPCSS